MIEGIEKILNFPVKRQWYRCTTPGCEQKLLIYDNTAKSSGLYIRCKKCGREIEIKV